MEDPDTCIADVDVEGASGVENLDTSITNTVVEGADRVEDPDLGIAYIEENLSQPPTTRRLAI